MKRILIILLTLCTLSTGYVLATAPSAYADAKSEICKGVNASSGASGCSDTTSSFNKIIRTGLNLFSIILGIVAVVTIMIGGFKYITSGGDSGNITSAKHTIVYALIGLVVVALAQVIVKFVLQKTV